MKNQIVLCLLSAAIGAALTLPAQSAPKASKTGSATVMSAESVNNADTTPVGAHSRGPAVLRAQILLDRAHFSPGEIDGAYGSNMMRAITGFQSSKGLPPTGEVDAATWAALNADSTAPLSTYTLTADDVDGPFSTIPSDMVAKSKLPKLGYRNALEGLGEKFHASPALLQQLNPGKSFKAGEQILAPNVTGASPLPAISKIVVDKSDYTVSLVDTEGNKVAQYPSSSGSKHDPLPIGDWKVQGIAMNPVFNYNPKLFWDANPEHSKATIPAGPNNPVGLVWVDLSKEHYGIHGTPEPSRIGKSESHGCIRMTNWSAVEMSKTVKAGTLVVLQE